MLISPLQRKAIGIGRNNKMRFRAVTKTSGWVYENVSEAPVVALERLELLKTAGIRVRSVIIAHEAPKILPEPKPQPQKYDFKITKILPEVGDLVGNFVQVFFLLAGLFVQVIMIDPAVIVELEDGSLLEVVTWYD